MPTIKKITVYRNKEDKAHELGKLGVTEIRRLLYETEENTVVNVEIYVDGKIKYDYFNGLYDIEYQ